MSVIILILQLGLVITSVFTVSSEYYTSAGPNLYLECLNDYLTEMVCSLTSDQVVTCSEYNINVSKYEEFFQCDLKQHNSSRGCGCLINVESGFVLSELFKVQVSRGKNVLFTKFVNTTESIKPKKPFRVTVNQTQNDNFLIVWETEYQVLGYVYVFSLDLISEIVYHVEGSKISTILNVTPSGRFKYELIGRNLKPNTNYIVRARIKSPLSNRFSDYSPAVKFTTPTSPDQIFKIIIPIVCVILILSVLIIYFFIDKIQTKWWNKIPTPKIATCIVKQLPVANLYFSCVQVPHLLSPQNELLTIHHVSSTLVQPKDKIWPASSPVDTKSENSLNNLDKDGNSSDVSYSQTVIQSLEANRCENNTHGKESLSTSNQMPVLTQYYNNLNGINCEVGRERADSFNFSNMPHKIYNPSSEHSVNPEIAFPALKKDLIPMIKTDFEYGLWTGSSGSENATQSHSPTPSGDITVVHGYQSVISLQDSASTHGVFISPRSNDVNLITESIRRKNAQNISCESPVISVDNEYRDVQSLLQNSGKQQILITDPELQKLWGQNLLSSAGIEIDCSYHRV